MSDAIAAVSDPPRRNRGFPGPRRAINRPSSLTQAMDLQAIAMAAARDPNVPSHVKAAHMRAWVDLEEVRLRLKGYGAPKPVEARNATSRRKPSTAAGPIGRVARAQAPAPAQDQPAPSAPASTEPGAPAK